MDTPVSQVDLSQVSPSALEPLTISPHDSLKRVLHIILRVFLGLFFAGVSIIFLYYFFLMPRQVTGKVSYINEQLIFTERVSVLLSSFDVGDLIVYEPQKYGSQNMSLLGIILEEEASSEKPYKLMYQGEIYQIGKHEIRGKVWYPTLSKDALSEYFKKEVSIRKKLN